jgi:hypothetical protein
MKNEGDTIDTLLIQLMKCKEEEKPPLQFRLQQTEQKLKSVQDRLSKVKRHFSCHLDTLLSYRHSIQRSHFHIFQMKRKSRSFRERFLPSLRTNSSKKLVSPTIIRRVDLAVNRDEMAIKIQKVFRGFLARKKLSADPEGEKKFPRKCRTFPQ